MSDNINNSKMESPWLAYIDEASESDNGAKSEDEFSIASDPSDIEAYWVVPASEAASSSSTAAGPDNGPARASGTTLKTEPNDNFDYFGHAQPFHGTVLAGCGAMNGQLPQVSLDSTLPASFAIPSPPVALAHRSMLTTGTGNALSTSHWQTTRPYNTLVESGNGLPYSMLGEFHHCGPFGLLDGLQDNSGTCYDEDMALTMQAQGLSAKREAPLQPMVTLSQLEMGDNAGISMVRAGSHHSAGAIRPQAFENAYHSNMSSYLWSPLHRPNYLSVREPVLAGPAALCGHLAFPAMPANNRKPLPDRSPVSDMSSPEECSAAEVSGATTIDRKGKAKAKAKATKAKAAKAKAAKTTKRAKGKAVSKPASPRHGSTSGSDSSSGNSSGVESTGRRSPIHKTARPASRHEQEKLRERMERLLSAVADEQMPHRRSTREEDLDRTKLLLHRCDQMSAANLDRHARTSEYSQREILQASSPAPSMASTATASSLATASSSVTAPASVRASSSVEERNAVDMIPRTILTLSDESKLALQHQVEERLRKDNFLLQKKREGMTYRQIRRLGGFQEAESTLRGRYRALTKPKEERVRKPAWLERDDALLHRAVLKLRANRVDKDVKISWKAVADYIYDRGGSYHFGNTTCRKRWDFLQQEEGGVWQGETNDNGE